jgi:thioredoxin
MTHFDDQSAMDAINNNSKVLVDLWAPWCGPCKMFGPVFEAGAELHPDIVMGKLNIDENKRIAAQYGIRSIPTVLAFQNGELKVAKTGAMDPASFEQFLKDAFGA